MAQIVAFGSETVIGSGVQDPLMLRWSDAGNINTWTATATKQAGSFRLSKGSAIVGAIQAPQTTLVWTDVDCWAMTYIQPPLVYSINIVGSECGLIGPKARTILGRNTYWMSPKGFFVFGDSGLQQIECPIWDSIFTNINPQPLNSKVFAGTDTPFGEVLWFYPSISSGNGECDSYVKFKPRGELVGLRHAQPQRLARRQHFRHAARDRLHPAGAAARDHVRQQRHGGRGSCP
jgi:hypothetical protein